MIGRIGAAIGFILQYAPPFRWTLGPRSRWWEPLRRWVSRVLGLVLDSRAGPRSITAGEYAGTLALPLAGVERLLWERGFRRNPMARSKTRNGAPEVGSWVYRASPLAENQLHLMLFRAPGDGIDVYAHVEPSSVNPFVGDLHFDGTNQDVAAGVRWARDRLPLEVTRATPDPPDGSWTRRG